MTNIEAPPSFLAFQRDVSSRARPPLGNHIVCTTLDLDEMHDQVARVLCGHNARSEPRHRPERMATLHHAPLASTSVLYLNYGTETRVGVEELGFFLLEVSLSGTCETTFGTTRARTQPGTLVTAGPGREFASHWDAQCSKLLLKIDSIALERQLGVILGRGPDEALVFELQHRIRDGHVASLWRNLRLLIGELEDPASLLNTVPGASREAEERLLWTLLHVLPSNYSAELCVESPQPATSFLDRVEEYVDAHCSEALTLTDLAAVAGVSGRTLLEGFRRHRGISPMRLLKNARLDHARSELLKAGPKDLTVTSIALSCGFGHLGRFSGEYKRRFGESPSTTLQRGRGAG